MGCCGRSTVLIVGVGLLAFVVVSCSSERNPDSDFQQVLESVKRRTTPPGAELLSQSGLARTDWSVSAGWDIATPMGNAEYLRWVSSQLQPEFKVVRTDESRLTFSKRENGDTYQVECRVNLEKDKLHVHVGFSAFPD
jgi:hypothetical protein